MRFIFLNIFGTGHVNPSLELVRRLVATGAEVVYFTHENKADVLREIGI